MPKHKLGVVPKVLPLLAQHKPEPNIHERSESGANFRVIVEQLQKEQIPDPVDMCVALGISHESMSAAIEALGNRAALEGELRFADLATVLVWGIALGYYYRDMKFTGKSIVEEIKPKIFVPSDPTGKVQ